MTHMMSKIEAENFQKDHDFAAVILSRMSKKSLRTVYVRHLGQMGYESLTLNNYSKDELISAILGITHPTWKLNESIHVRYHDEWKNEACDYCRAETCALDPNAQPPF